MRMDITAPVEMTGFSLAEFDGQRAQAYLTFLNEDERVLTGVRGTLDLCDADGNPNSSRKVSFSPLHALPGQGFSGHMALENIPTGATAFFSPEAASFLNGDVWEIKPEKVSDCTPAVEPEGMGRTMLISVAGEDAICYPRRDADGWFCVCGRKNPFDRMQCMRCVRDYEDVMRLSRRAVSEKFNALRENERKNAPRKQRTETKKETKKSGMSAALRGILSAIGMAVILIALFAGLWYAFHPLLERIMAVQAITNFL